MFVKNTGLLEQRNEWPVSCLDEHELQRVAVECDALQRRDDCMKESVTSFEFVWVLSRLFHSSRSLEDMLYYMVLRIRICIIIRLSSTEKFDKCQTVSLVGKFIAG